MFFYYRPQIKLIDCSLLTIVQISPKLLPDFTIVIISYLVNLLCKFFEILKDLFMNSGTIAFIDIRRIKLFCFVIYPRKVLYVVIFFITFIYSWVLAVIGLDSERVPRGRQ